MKGLLLGLTAALAATAVNAQTASTTAELDANLTDNTKYCYYANEEYSEGSLMEQEDSLMQCVDTTDSESLVWRAYEPEQS
ncbi:DUF1496 domain-containing protein [Aliidiomarina soli]|uniref:DUF1496 domain-containing protein n=1 Tax=Aliidiomarina soli TaxID=1928574 RepID=A0A432WLL2_9GAMM|nr:DUF1496 domain-containing protein [Aliidiomarina soli]RUO34706.1 hypothetical protein CWE14_01510 [Aliidiomarina soli]